MRVVVVEQHRLVLAQGADGHDVVARVVVHVGHGVLEVQVRVAGHLITYRKGMRMDYLFSNSCVQEKLTTIFKI